jgi:hypothetical protein
LILFLPTYYNIGEFVQSKQVRETISSPKKQQDTGEKYDEANIGRFYNILDNSECA